MVTPELGVASIFRCNFIIQKRQYSERVQHNQRIAVDPFRVLALLYNKNFQHKMNATPSFGVTMISKEPSNTQLTLEQGFLNYEFLHF